MSCRWLVRFRALGIVAISATATGSACAWDSAVHTGLIQISETSAKIVKNLSNGSEAITRHFPHEMLKVCSERAKEGERISRELACGADDPDQKRTWYYSISHKSDAEARATKALVCAVYHSRAPSNPQEVPYSRWMIARQLGESIHYVQDVADPTNESDIGRYKSRARLEGRDLVETALLQSAGRDEAQHFSFRTHLAQAKKRMGAGPILRAARNASKTSAPRIRTAYEALDAAVKRKKEAMDAGISGPPLDALTLAVVGARHDVHYALLDVLADIVALQDRWLEAYLQAQAADALQGAGAIAGQASELLGQSTGTGPLRPDPRGKTERDEVKESCLGEGQMTAAGRTPVTYRWIGRFIN